MSLFGLLRFPSSRSNHPKMLKLRQALSHRSILFGFPSVFFILVLTSSGDVKQPPQTFDFFLQPRPFLQQCRYMLTINPERNAGSIWNIGCRQMFRGHIITHLRTQFHLHPQVRFRPHPRPLGFPKQQTTLLSPILLHHLSTHPPSLPSVFHLTVTTVLPPHRGFLPPTQRFPQL